MPRRYDVAFQGCLHSRRSTPATNIDMTLNALESYNAKADEYRNWCLTDQCFCRATRGHTDLDKLCGETQILCVDALSIVIVMYSAAHRDHPEAVRSYNT